MESLFLHWNTIYNRINNSIKKKLFPKKKLATTIICNFYKSQKYQMTQKQRHALLVKLSKICRRVRKMIKNWQGRSLLRWDLRKRESLRIDRKWKMKMMRRTKKFSLVQIAKMKITKKMMILINKILKKTIKVIKILKNQKTIMIFRRNHNQRHRREKRQVMLIIKKKAINQERKYHKTQKKELWLCWPLKDWIFDLIN